MNAANFDQYGLLSHSVANASHQHHAGSHQHQHHQQPHHQHAAFNPALGHAGAQGDDIFIARQTVSLTLKPRTAAWFGKLRGQNG